MIYEFPDPVDFTLSEKDKEERLKTFIERVNYSYFNCSLGDFISANKDGFYNNEVVEEYYLSSDKIIPKGMKLVKAFKYFEHNEDRLKNIQSEASCLIQEDKIHGRLCFSVHPLDFLSISESTYNWRSCHALDGEYRAGNLSYMLDKSTFICYLKSDKDTVLPRFPDTVLWNNKKWRVLLYMSDRWDAMMAGRQYPFTAAHALDFVKYALNTKLGFDLMSDWQDTVIDSYVERTRNPQRPKKLGENYIVINRQIYLLKDIVEDAEDSRQYNDLLYSSFYLPIFVLKYSYISKPHWTIGAAAPCLECGNDIISSSDYMRCIDCELKYGDAEDDNYAFCNCCGQHALIENMYEVGDDAVLVCADCADENCKRCEVCGNLYFTDDIIYNKNCDMYLCPWCNKDAEENGKKYGFKDLRQYI